MDHIAAVPIRIVHRRSIGARLEGTDLYMDRLVTFVALRVVPWPFGMHVHLSREVSSRKVLGMANATAMKPTRSIRVEWDLILAELSKWS
jgi:hypothetical protein